MSSRVSRVLVAAVLIATFGAVALPTLAVEGQERFVVYDDALANGFQNWSWADVDTDHSEFVSQGATSIAVDFGPWEGLYLGVDPAVPIASGAIVRFSILAAEPGNALELRMFDQDRNAGPARRIEPSAVAWQTIDVAVDELGGFGLSTGIWWQNATGNDNVRVYVDDVVLLSDGGPGAPPPDDPGNPGNPGSGVLLEVDLGSRTMVRSIKDPATDRTTEQRLGFPHSISEGVYGLNFAADPLRSEFGIGVNRWGGNGVERYNHTNGDSNKGHDYFFMTDTGEPGGVDAFEQVNRASGADTLLTVPLIGWVSDGPPACSYPVNDYFGSRHNATPMDQVATHWADGNVVCGNGHRNGELVQGPDPTLTSTAVDSGFVGDWVGQLVARHGSAAEGGIERYALGNEPGLWHFTHADVRAEPIGRSEIIARNTDYARAVKGADPTASVIGPVLWGGYSYFVTSEELAQGLRPGQVNTFVADYLTAMADAESDGGVRLIDGLAIHFYDDRVYQGGTDELRLESTRSLWDPSYAPADWWPVRDFLDGDGYAVIPRMRSLIDEHYPDTELAITEYNFGGIDTLAGGLAQADALGIFGREGVDVATLWDPYNEQLSPPLEQFTRTPAMYAFRMYRNYDGNGGRFGDEALYTSSADPEALSVYAARRRADGVLTVMVINRSTTAATARLGINGRVGTEAEGFRYGVGNLQAIESLGAVDVAGGADYGYPARSVTLLVIDPPGDDPVSPPTTAPPSTTSPTTAPPPSGPGTTGRPWSTLTIAPPSIPAPRK